MFCSSLKNTKVEKMLKTHKNFKSFDPKVKDAETMNNLVGDIIKCVHFSKITPLWETNNWKKNELEYFEIDLEMVDRLYYIKVDGGSKWEDRYEFICRMEYNGKLVFIALKAIHNPNWTGHGIILISADIDCFIKSILSKKNSYMRPVYLSLVEDGVRLSEYVYDCETYYRYIENGDEPFKKLVQFNDIRGIITHYREFLPDSLQNNLKDFINYAENKRHVGDLW